jgi:hypothetical protein
MCCTIVGCLSQGAPWHRQKMCSSSLQCIVLGCSMLVVKWKSHTLHCLYCTDVTLGSLFLQIIHGQTCELVQCCDWSGNLSTSRCSSVKMRCVWQTDITKKSSRACSLSPSLMVYMHCHPAAIFIYCSVKLFSQLKARGDWLECTSLSLKKAYQH